MKNRKNARFTKNRQLIEAANALVMKDCCLPLLDDKARSQSPFLSVALDHVCTELWKRKELILPEIRFYNDTVFVASDYGGESKSMFRTYSFVFAAYKGLAGFFKQCSGVRQEYGLNKPFKEIAFKDLEYGPLKAALPRLLEAFEYIPGLLLTIIVDKDVQSVIGQNNNVTKKELSSLLADLGYGTWKRDVAEKLLRIVHPIGYFAALLTGGGMNVCWMTDHDAIAANDKQTDGLRKYFGETLGRYVSEPYRTIAFAKPFADENAKFNFDDVLAVADLASGSMASLFTAEHVDPCPTIKVEANEVLLWLCKQGLGLKRMTLRIADDDSGELKIAKVELVPKEQSGQIELVPLFF